MHTVLFTRQATEITNLSQRVVVAEDQAEATKQSVLMAKRRLKATFDECLDDALPLDSGRTACA